MNKFTMSFCTTNGLLMVDCSGIRDNIIPKLHAIFRQFTKMVAKDLLRMSKDFTNEVNELVEVCYKLQRLQDEVKCSGAGCSKPVWLKRWISLKYQTTLCIY